MSTACFKIKTQLAIAKQSTFMPTCRVVSFYWWWIMNILCDLWCLNHTCKLTFQPGKFWWHFLFILPPYQACNNVVFTLCNGYILLFLSATLWQRGNLHIHLYSHFTQNSVVNVNWHINKKKQIEIWQIIVRKLKKKEKVFWGRGAYCNAVAQGPLDILRRPWLGLKGFGSVGLKKEKKNVK